MAEILQVVLIGVIGLGVVALVRRARQRADIRRNGELTDATITGVEVGSLGEVGDAFWIAKYDYVDHGGVEHIGKSPLLQYDPTARVTGNRCTIRVDREHPERSAWIDPTS